MVLVTVDAVAVTVLMTEVVAVDVTVDLTVVVLGVGKRAPYTNP